MNVDLTKIIERTTLDQKREAARASKKPRTLKKILRMAERALARADRAIAEAEDVLPPQPPIACKAGCPFCCHIRLTASAPEVLLLLTHIQTTWAEDDVQGLLGKVRNLDGVTRGKSDHKRAQQRLPCPLLKDGSCSVHQVRPLSCRAVASVDVGACREAYNARMESGVPMYEPQYQIANGAGYGLYAGLAQNGLEAENIEIIAALALGLDDHKIGNKWLKGLDPFAPAKS
ncbi:YkgJ family cysteine cluster protein [Magnetovibrio sp. PR-2]|uniref:YkgJ family cysteine cluster protein n=1 Tax=Magnetovibrio sp. PR-2 TaxID=3120356 RepID=UPI002FCDFD07